jgi:RNase P/RNase MRP subunit POP5
MNISLSAIDDILRKEDIEGLLHLGAPKDEYSREAKKIRFVLEQMSEGGVGEEDISAAVARIWQDSFGPFTDDDIQKRAETFRSVARQIIKTNRVQL